MPDSTEFEELYTQLTTLNLKQQLAAEALLNGKTHREAAEAAGCCRETVTEWANNHPAFRATLQHARLAAFRESSERRSRIHSALEVRVLKEIESDMLSIEQLLAVAKALPASTVPEPTGPVATTEAEVAARVTEMLSNQSRTLAFLLRRSLADDLIGCSLLDRDTEAEIVAMKLISERGDGISHES